MTKIAVALVCGITAFCAEAVARTSVLNELSNRDKVEFNPSTVLSATGNRIEVDTTQKPQETKWLRHVWLKQGILKPYTRYVVSFRISVPAEYEKTGFVLLLCRPLSANHEHQDAMALQIQPKDGIIRREIRFSTADKTDYSIQFHTYKHVKFTVSDFELFEIPEDKFFGTDDKAYQGSFGNLPTGAREFEVERPKATSGRVVKAADFGFSAENENNIEALNRAVEYCRKEGASVLELAPGDYRCFSPGLTLQLSNLKDFTLDGKGARLICRRQRNSAVHIYSCERMVLKNLSLDWDWQTEPLASLVEVIRTDAQSYDLKFLHYEDYPAKHLRLAFLSPWDPVRKTIGYEGDCERALEMYLGRNKIESEWLSGNVLRMKQKPGSFQVGQIFRLQHYYYDMGCFGIFNNTHLTLEDVHILSTPGNAIVISGKEQYTQFIRVTVLPPAGDERRVISSTADHCHIAQSQGYFKMLGCDFGYGADDCLNVHDTTAFCRRVDDHTIRTQNAKSAGRVFAVGALLELRHGDYSPTGFKARIKELNIIDRMAGTYEITFEETVPEELFDGFIIFNWDFNSHNVILRDCFFHDNRARGILLLTHDITVENCRFKHNQMGAVKIETGYTFNLWSEGYGASNIVVRNCNFEQSDPSEVTNDGKVRDIYMGVYLKRDPSAERTKYPILHEILFENNTFTDSYGLIAFCSSVGNLTFRNNTFRNLEVRKRPKEYRACFYLTHASDVKIVNNTYIASDTVPRPGVYADPDTVTNLLVEGNHVQK